MSSFSLSILEGDGKGVDLPRFKVKRCLVWHNSPKVGESSSLGICVSLASTSSILNDNILPNVFMSMLSISAFASSSFKVTVFGSETGSNTSSFNLAAVIHKKHNSNNKSNLVLNV